MNFGVREVAISTVADKPGYVFVIDTGVNASVAALQPASRKRHRTELTGNTSAKQDAKLLRDLAALDRESHRDIAIPVPIRHRDNAGRVTHGKVTPAVRKILQSQKTFANHLADYEALVATGAQPIPVVPASHAPKAIAATPATPSADSPASAALTKRSHKKKDPNEHLKNTRRTSGVQAPTPVVKVEAPVKEPDVRPVLLATLPDPPPHPRDDDVLLKSRMPSLPSQEEIEKLLAIPPLSYNEARGDWAEEDRRKPVRHFCEVCGYWGRVKCMRCGGRVCALECLTVHQEECFTRYGA